MRVARPPGLAAGYALRDAWLACAGLHPNKKPRDNWTFEPEEEERIDLSAGIAWFGDILNRGAACRDRVPFGLWKSRGRCQALASGGGSTHDLTPLVWRTAGR